MKKRKKLILSVVAVLAVGGIVAGIVYAKNNNKKAYVEKAEYLNNDWVLSESSSEGVISDSGSQTISLGLDRFVSQNYVKTGDTVKAGDPLFRYDTTEKEIELEAKKIEVQDAQSVLVSSKELLKKYQDLSVASESDYEADSDDDSQAVSADAKRKMIQDQTLEVKKNENRLKLAENALNLAKIDLENSTEYAKIAGVVKSIGEPDSPAIDGMPYCVITAASGLQLIGTISEFDYGKVNIGDKVTVRSWLSGSQTDATIISVSDYPTSGEFYYGGNPNVSGYEYTALLDNSDAFSIGEDVAVYSAQSAESGRIVLERIYVRTENGSSYCMIRGKDRRLKKQPVTFKSTQYSEYVEILSGIDSEDYIAFPYGDSAKEGTKTTTEMMFSLF